MWRPCKLHNSLPFCFVCLLRTVCPSALPRTHANVGAKRRAKTRFVRWIRFVWNFGRRIRTPTFVRVYTYICAGRRSYWWQSAVYFCSCATHCGNCASKFRGDGNTLCKIPCHAVIENIGTHLRLLANIVVRGQEGGQKLLEMGLIRCHLILSGSNESKHGNSWKPRFSLQSSRNGGRLKRAERNNWLGCQGSQTSALHSWSVFVIAVNLGMVGLWWVLLLRGLSNFLLFNFLCNLVDTLESR